MSTMIRNLIAALLLASLSDRSAAQTQTKIGICELQMMAAAKRHDVPLGVLYAVGMTETGRKGKLHPFALNIEGRAVFATSRREALRHFDLARKKGLKLIDLGCMQVNHHYHGSRFKTVGDMLDPALNVNYAAQFLQELRRREGNWTMAVARYHAGPDNDPAQKRYICAVIRNLVLSGFGSWTPPARKFCK